MNDVNDNHGAAEEFYEVHRREGFQIDIVLRPIRKDDLQQTTLHCLAPNEMLVITNIARVWPGGMSNDVLRLGARNLMLGNVSFIPVVPQKDHKLEYIR